MPHNSTMPRERVIMDQARVEQFIARPGNIKPIGKGRQCGDGRSAEAGLSIFGADVLVAQTLAAMNISMTPEALVDLIIDMNTARGEKTYFHTDTHAADSLNNVGCGQLKKPTLPENEEKYKLDANHVLRATDAQEIIVRLNEKAKDDPEHVVKQVLTGDHVEGEVIINLGETNTVRHDDGTDQAFVVDKTAGEKYLTEMFEELEKRIPELAGRFDEFMNVQNHLTKVTAELLAHGLPVYEINVDGKVEIKEVGNV